MRNLELISNCYNILLLLFLFLSKFIPVHSYALMIISVAICKLLGVIESYYESCCSKWFNFVVKILLHSFTCRSWSTYTSIEQVISSFSLIYFILVVTTVVGAIIGTAIVGHFVGFYIIEGSNNCWFMYG